RTATLFPYTTLFRSLEVLGAVGLSIVCWSRLSRVAKLLITYGVGVCYVGLILTGSRGGYLSTVTSLLVFGVLSSLVLARGPPRFFWRIMIPASLAAIILAAGVIVFVKKSDFLGGRAKTVFERPIIRFVLWKVWIEHWKLE